MPARLATTAFPARRWLRTAVFACAPVLAAAGCGDTLTGTSDVAGRYDLAAVEGRSVPYTYTDASYTYTVLDGELVLRDDRTYRAQATARVVDRYTGDTELDDELDTGTYTLSGRRLTFYPDAGSGTLFENATTGTVSGSTVDVDVFTFVRR